MGFFDSIPQPTPRQPRRPAWARPEAVIPASVPGEVLLIRTDQVAVAVGSIRAYPTGFEFTMHGRLRRDDATAGRGVSDPFGQHRGDPGVSRAPEDVLRLGVLYADGRRTATSAGSGLAGDETDQLMLLQEGGGGSNRRWDFDFWVYPLPPDGPLILVASWLEHGVAETRAELDGTAIRAASSRSMTLWPDEPEGEASSSWRSSKITSWGG